MIVEVSSFDLPRCSHEFHMRDEIERSYERAQMPEIVSHITEDSERSRATEVMDVATVLSDEIDWMPFISWCSFSEHVFTRIFPFERVFFLSFSFEKEGKDRDIFSRNTKKITNTFPDALVWNDDMFRLFQEFSILPFQEMFLENIHIASRVEKWSEVTEMGDRRDLFIYGRSPRKRDDTLWSMDMMRERFLLESPSTRKEYSVLSLYHIALICEKSESIVREIRRPYTSPYLCISDVESVFSFGCADVDEKVHI